METDPNFVPLLQAKDNVELEMAKDLLGSAQIPYVIDTTDRFEVLELLEGQAATGAQCVMVPSEKLEAAVALLEGAWGSELIAARRAKLKE